MLIALSAPCCGPRSRCQGRLRLGSFGKPALRWLGRLHVVDPEAKGAEVEAVCQTDQRQRREGALLSLHETMLVIAHITAEPAQDVLISMVGLLCSWAESQQEQA
jgi:hypothetical protein